MDCRGTLLRPISRLLLYGSFSTEHFIIAPSAHVLECTKHLRSRSVEKKRIRLSKVLDKSLISEIRIEEWLPRHILKEYDRLLLSK